MSLRRLTVTPPCIKRVNRGGERTGKEGVKGKVREGGERGGGGQLRWKFEPTPLNLPLRNPRQLRNIPRSVTGRVYSVANDDNGAETDVSLSESARRVANP